MGYLSIIFGFLSSFTCNCGFSMIQTSTQSDSYSSVFGYFLKGVNTELTVAEKVIILTFKEKRGQ